MNRTIKAIFELALLVVVVMAIIVVLVLFIHKEKKMHY
jgi:hypothetical protein